MDRKRILSLAAALACAGLAFAAREKTTESKDSTNALEEIDPAHVCMVNDAAFDKEQIPVEVNGKTYYGCCKMCKERLENDAQVRTAVDPVSGKEVDKANAVIGRDAEDHVFYFENEANLKKFNERAKKDEKKN